MNSVAGKLWLSNCLACANETVTVIARGKLAAIASDRGLATGSAWHQNHTEANPNYLPSRCQTLPAKTKTLNDGWQDRNVRNLPPGKSANGNPGLA